MKILDISFACHYADCRFLFVMLGVVMLSVVMLKVVMLIFMAPIYHTIVS